MQDSLLQIMFKKVLTRDNIDECTDLIPIFLIEDFKGERGERIVIAMYTRVFLN